MELEKNKMCTIYDNVNHFVWDVKSDLGMGNNKVLISDKFKNAFLCKKKRNGNSLVVRYDPDDSHRFCYYFTKNQPFNLDCYKHSLKELKALNDERLFPVVDAMIKGQIESLEKSTGITIDKS